MILTPVGSWHWEVQGARKCWCSLVPSLSPQDFPDALITNYYVRAGTPAAASAFLSPEMPRDWVLPDTEIPPLGLLPHAHGHHSQGSTHSVPCVPVWRSWSQTRQGLETGVGRWRQPNLFPSLSRSSGLPCSWPTSTWFLFITGMADPHPTLQGRCILQTETK